jgi:hypothetical protein
MGKDERLGLYYALHGLVDVSFNFTEKEAKETNLKINDLLTEINKQL